MTNLSVQITKKGWQFSRATKIEQCYGSDWHVNGRIIEKLVIVGKKRNSKKILLCSFSQVIHSIPTYKERKIV